MFDWSDDMFATCVGMSGPQWFAFARSVGKARNDIWRANRDVEAGRLAETMDMTSEGFVREWARRGRRSEHPLDAWEHAYQRVGLIERAEQMGYIWIGRDVGCTISLTQNGEVLLPHPVP